MKVIPTLSTDGFISNPKMIMAKLFQYYLSCDYYQSTPFKGTNKSLRYTMSKFDNDTNRLIREIESDLTHIFGPYFSNLAVSANLISKPNDGLQIIKIDVKGDANGTSYSLERDVKLVNGDISGFEMLLDTDYAYYNSEKRGYI